MKEMGVYMIGQTAFNPNTNEKFYRIKVGCSSDVKKRLNQYKTYNPFMFYIDKVSKEKNRITAEDTEKIRNMELLFHRLMELFLKLQNDNHTEWYTVCEEDYMDFCEKGFEKFTPIFEQLGINKKSYLF